MPSAKALEKKLELENARLEADLIYRAKQNQALDQEMINRQRLADASADQAAMAKKRYSLAFVSTLVKAIWSVLAAIGNFLKVFLRDLSPYIALLLVILFIIWAFGSRSGGSGRSSRNRATRSNAMRSSNLFGWTKVFMPSYRARSIFNFFKGNPKSIARPIERFGRCDNAEWQHRGGDGAGLCVHTLTPKDIEWTLSDDKISDLRKLPQKLKSVATKNNQKLKIYIPWAAQGPFFLPQCSLAYFKVMDDNGVERKEDASYLLRDNGMTCERIVRESAKFGVAYRPRDSENKRDFATEGNPKCNA